MGNLRIYFLQTLLALAVLVSTTTAQNPNNPTDFIKSSCSACRYPELCVSTLSIYATTVQQNEQQLVQAALQVSLDRAQSASAFIYRLFKLNSSKQSETLALKDCIRYMGDTVAQLSQSLKELSGMPTLEGQSFVWRVGNVKSWVSTALTNENSCLYGFSDPSMNGNVKISVSAKVLNCAQVTSNALALVQQFAARHKAGDSP